MNTQELLTDLTSEQEGLLSGGFRFIPLMPPYKYPIIKLPRWIWF
jgi:hypothetical protein